MDAERSMVGHEGERSETEGLLCREVGPEGGEQEGRARVYVGRASFRMAVDAGIPQIRTSTNTSPLGAHVAFADGVGPAHRRDNTTEPSVTARASEDDTWIEMLRGEVAGASASQLTIERAGVPLSRFLMVGVGVAACGAAFLLHARSSALNAAAGLASRPTVVATTENIAAPELAASNLPLAVAAERPVPPPAVKDGPAPMIIQSTTQKAPIFARSPALQAKTSATRGDVRVVPKVKLKARTAAIPKKIPARWVDPWAP